MTQKTSTVELAQSGEQKFFLRGDAWVAKPIKRYAGSREWSWHDEWFYSFGYDWASLDSFGLFLTLLGDGALVTFRVGNWEADRKSHFLFTGFLQDKSRIRQSKILSRMYKPGVLKSDWEAFSGPFPLGMSLVDMQGLDQYAAITSGYNDSPVDLCVAFVHDLVVKQIVIQKGILASSEVLYQKQFG